MEANPSYPKGCYRRGTAEFALGRAKAARKDFRQVVRLRPRDRDARAKLAACDKAVKAAAFAAAILSDEQQPLSNTFRPESIQVEGGYDGPHPAGGAALLHDSTEEAKLFEPGALPREFVLNAVQRFRERGTIHKRYVARLLLGAKRHYELEPSLLQIPIPLVCPGVSERDEDDKGEEGKEGDKDHKPDEDHKADKDYPRLTVCGDTHGQYYDVLNIFAIN